MTYSNVSEIGNRIYLIDGYDFGKPNRTGTYLIEEEELTLIETGPSMSNPYILAGLKDLNIDPKKIKYIIVTHIHLDHSGGLGLLLRSCPNATVVVHPKGARHLIDPSRLITGARAIYKEAFDKLYDPILPVPESKIIIKEDGETLKISENCSLIFYDTPGHCNHHFSVFDPVSNGIFTGDTIGINYNNILKDVGVELYIPSTTPNQFNPDSMLNSLMRIKDLKVDHIYFSHFSIASNVEEVFKQIEEWLPLFVGIGEQSEKFNKDHHWISEQITMLIRNYLNEQGVPENHKVYEYLNIDIPIDALGIVDYFSKRNVSK